MDLFCYLCVVLFFLQVATIITLAITIGSHYPMSPYDIYLPEKDSPIKI